MNDLPTQPVLSEVPPAPIGITVPSKLHPPIDVSRITKENGVKELIKKLLDLHGWFHFAMAAGGFGGTGGLHDRFAVKDGVLVTIEAKFGRGKLTPLQKGFAAQIISNDCYSFCVSEKTIDHFAWWLESFEIAKQCQMQGVEVPPEHGARLLNAISVLTDPFAK